MTFPERVAIVGASTGIGLATALRLVEGGARVAICSHDAAPLGRTLVDGAAFCSATGHRS